MIKCEVIERFDLKDYNKLKNVKKVISRKENEFGVGDTFECDEEMAKYLLGDNVLKKVVVKVVEVEPKTPTIIGHKADDVEYVVPLDDENMEKLSKAIEKRINENGLTVEGLGIKKEIKPKKKKSKK